MLSCIRGTAVTDLSMGIDHCDVPRRRVVDGFVPVCLACADPAMRRGPIRTVGDLLAE